MYVFVIFCVCVCVCLSVCVSCPQVYNGEKDKEKELSQTTQSIIAAAMLIAQYSGKNSVWLSKR